MTPRSWCARSQLWEDRQLDVAAFQNSTCRAGVGQVTLWSSNVTSLAANWMHVLNELEMFHVSFGVITETKSTLQEQHWLSKAFAARGWSTTWSSPIETQGLKGRTGGTLVVASADWVKVDCPLEVDLTASCTNWCASCWQSNTGSDNALIVAYYGHPQAQRSTANDVAKLCSTLASFEDHIVFLAGDFNMNITEHYYLPYGMLDVHEALALQSQQALMNTSYTPNGQARPDRVYMPSTQWTTLQDASAYHDSTLATHTPLLVVLTRLRQRALTQMLPPVSLARGEIGDGPAASTFAEWTDLWGFWVSGENAQSRYKSLGIATVEAEVSWTRTTTSRWVRRLRNFTGRIVALTRMHDKSGDNAQRLWRRIAKQAKPFLERYGVPSTFGLRDSTESVTEDVMINLRNHFQQVIYELTKQEATTRAQLFRCNLHKYRGVNKLTSRLLKDDESTTLLSLKLDDRVATSPDDIFDLLRDSWRRYHETPEPMIELQRLEPWLAFLPRRELHLGHLEPDLLRKAAASMSDTTAAGADQWSPGELKRLPEAAWVQLAAILEGIEHDAQWPRQMQRIWLAVLAKTSLAGRPDKIRPIAILPSCYRLWAKARFQQLRPWLETILADSMYAYRPNRDALQMGLILAKDLEAAVLHHRKWQIVSLDCTKAFPSVPRSVLWTLLGRLGFPHVLCQALRAFYAHADVVWRLRGKYISRFSWQPLKGVFQGCPLSVALFNVLLLPLALRIEHEVPGINAFFYADDLTLTGSSEEDMGRALRLCEEYLQLLGIELNPSKTQFLSVCGAPDKLQIGGVWIDKMESIKVVGTYLHAKGDATEQKRCDIDLDKVQGAYWRLRGLPLQLFYKDNVIDQIIGARWRFGCWHCIPNKWTLKTWRATQLAAVRPAMSRGCRSPTVYHGLALKAHKVDPLYTPDYGNFYVFYNIIMDGMRILHGTWLGPIRPWAPSPRLLIS